MWTYQISALEPLSYRVKAALKIWLYLVLELAPNQNNTISKKAIPLTRRVEQPLSICLGTDGYLGNVERQDFLHIELQEFLMRSEFQDSSYSTGEGDGLQ